LQPGAAGLFICSLMRTSDRSCRSARAAANGFENPFVRAVRRCANCTSVVRFYAHYATPFFERLCSRKCTGIARSNGCKKLDAPSAQKKIRAGNYLGGTANAVVGKHPGSIKKR
jgi:hypothetical protein